MAGTRFAYVRNFELPDPVLPSTFMVVRIDGKGFHKFSEAHSFTKPNDADALELMNEAARHVMQQLKGEVILAFGESDEYSFLFQRNCTLYNRRNSKIVTHVVSLFTGSYIFNWSKYFPDKTLNHPPSFDGRLIPYPNIKEIRDYFSWRQADTHINNLYNTTFWALVLQGGQTEREAHETLRGTISSQKNEILFSRFNINYEKLPAIFRKGTTILWEQIQESGFQLEDTNATNQASKNTQKQKQKSKKALRTLHVDIIGADFWNPKVEGTALSGKQKQSNASEKKSRHDTSLQKNCDKLDVAIDGDREAARKGREWEDEDRLRGSGLAASLFDAPCN